MLLLFALAVLASCRGSNDSIVLTSPSTAHVSSDGQAETESLSFDVPGASQPVLDRLCTVSTKGANTPSGGPSRPSAAIREIEEQLQEVRGLSFEEPVPAEPVTAKEMARRIGAETDAILGGDQVGRRSLAWQTLGAIPEGTDLAAAYRGLMTGGVIGYYDPDSGALVFIGSGDPTSMERFVLAHEFTHALDDQHFNLGRFDHLAAECDDEAYAGALATTEGSAQLSAFSLVDEFFSSADTGALFADTFSGSDGAIPEDTPPFIFDELGFPYDRGMVFMEAMRDRGGIEAVNDALEAPPVSTEQILHPERYPGDEPRNVEVGDLGAKVGDGWVELDVMGVGEDFLSRMLAVHDAPLEASEAAAGWDGGRYRAWRKGDQVVVALATVWDTEPDAEAFEEALNRYIDQGIGADRAEVARGGSTVNALFATDAASLAAFTRAATPVD